MMRASMVSRAVLRYPGRCTAAFSSQTSAPIGLIGLGKMGAAMAANFVEVGHSLVVYDGVELNSLADVDLMRIVQRCLRL